MSNEVAVRPAGEVAPLYDPSAFDIEPGDVRLSRVYFGNPLSKAVTNDDIPVKIGDVYVAAGADDPDAQVVWPYKVNGKVNTEPGVLFQVLRMDRGKSYDPKDGTGLKSWAFGDPEAHENAWTTWTYTIILPDVDQEMPYKILLTKSNRPTAQRMNMVLGKAAKKGPIYNVGFRLSSAEASDSEGHKWTIAVVKLATASDEGIAVAESLYDFVAATNDTPSAIVVEEGPAI